MQSGNSKPHMLVRLERHRRLGENLFRVDEMTPECRPEGHEQACNLFVATPKEAIHKLDALRHYCENEGTNYAANCKTMLYMGTAIVSRDTDSFVEEMRGFAAAGIEGVMVMPSAPSR